MNARQIQPSNTVVTSLWLTSEQAAARYDALGRGSWHEDSLWGLFFALDAELSRQLVRRFHREDRRCKRKRASADEPLPGWVKPAFDEFVVATAPVPTPIELAVAARNPEMMMVIEEMLKTGSADWYRYLEPRARAVFEVEFIPLVRRYHSRFASAARAELKAFYYGTLIYFHRRGWGDPKPGEVRLLAAARGLEPITEGLDKARKLWEDRILRWKGEMDRSWPEWRRFARKGIDNVRGGEEPLRQE
jgi:hypothetical protein